MTDSARALLIGVLITIVSIGGVLYIGGLELVLRCGFIALIGFVVLALLHRGQRLLAVLLMPAALFTIFPSKRVRALLEQARQREANSDPAD